MTRIPLAQKYLASQTMQKKKGRIYTKLAPSFYLFEHNAGRKSLNATQSYRKTVKVDRKARTRTKSAVIPVLSRS